MRNNDWLADRLAEIWYRHFSDVKQCNEVDIKFGRSSKSRLGSIGMPGWQDKHSRYRYLPNRQRRKGRSTITVTGYFKDERVPAYVVDVTVAHELVHYAHGFHSPYPQLYRYPHRGGVVDKELRQREMGKLLKQQQVWLKRHWSIFTEEQPRSIQRRSYERLSFLPAH